jgi:hypothetical protein
MWLELSSAHPCTEERLGDMRTTLRTLLWLNVLCLGMGIASVELLGVAGFVWWFGYAATILASLTVACVPAPDVDLRARIVAGFYLGAGSAVVVVAVHNGDTFDTTFHAFLCITAGPSFFAALTDMVSGQLAGPKEWDDKCETCGYCLIGLTEPRCPECSTPIPEQQAEFLKELQPR